MPQLDPWFFEHRYFETYAIASTVSAWVLHPFAYLHNLEDLWLDGGVLQFIQPYNRREPAIYPVIQLAIEDTFDSWHTLTFRPGGDDYDDEPQNMCYPIEAACETFEIDYQPFLECSWLTFPNDYDPRGRFRSWKAEANAYEEYFAELKLMGTLEELSGPLCDEIFFILFLNREALAGFNRLVAMHLDDLYVDDLEEEYRSLFRSNGVLLRKDIPAWAYHAVYYRDRGACVRCGQRVDRDISPRDTPEIDHIVPLSKGGLNDVTNLQILCRSCNRSKSNRDSNAGTRYERWWSKK
ncbi:HNH endonuclease signature motif containing protein [Pseudofrankia sp. BMG5.36]|uniref:HNH endonuclease n=1 Tax=Pseudofrankia sp. BMG5.36 TaxID=1834512 RepID=UPI0012FFBF76|nr:HNH endonuclease signature motif containing protein [Pseudofrankia sp. BMG5.36]